MVLFFRFLLFLSCFLFSEVIYATPISHVYVFGDSLSDNGNLFHSTAGNLPPSPYYYGRFSNGIVWPEILVQRIGLTENDLTDYATGGALTHSSVPPGLEMQVDNFLQKSPNITSHDLFIIWTGANDYIYDSVVDYAKIRNSVDIIDRSIKRLISQGAKIFLVPNLPDISRTPWAHDHDTENGNHQLSHSLLVAVGEHNRLLREKLNYIDKYYNVAIMRLDTYERLGDIMTHPDRYHIKNTQKACFTPEKPEGEKLCDNPNEYLFWDFIHPTLTIHDELARESDRILKQKGYSVEYKMTV